MISLIGDGGHAKVIRRLIADGGIVFPEDGWIVAVGDNRNRRKEVLAHPDNVWAVVKHRISYTAGIPIVFDDAQQYSDLAVAVRKLIAEWEEL